MKPVPLECPEDLTLPQYANLLTAVDAWCVTTVTVMDAALDLTLHSQFCDGAQSLRVSWFAIRASVHTTLTSKKKSERLTSYDIDFLTL